MQKCSKCKEDKPLDQFGKGNKNNGTSSWCKPCESIRHKNYSDNPEVKRRNAKNQHRFRHANPSRSMLNSLRQGAKRRGIEFNLTIEDCAIPSHCPVLGLPLVFGSEKINGIISDNSPSMDKIVPSKGYTKGNVQVISWRANHLKNNATLQELEAICRYVRDSTQ